MRNFTLPFPILMSALIAIAYATPATAAKTSKLQGEINECMKRWMPPGTADKERAWFNPDLRCEANKAVPKLDEHRCERTVDRLAKLAAELNDSVENACEKYIPELVADGCGQDSRDAHCIGKMQELLKRASENSASFDAKLKTYIERLVKLRKLGLEAAQKVYEATLYSDRRSQAIEDANKYFQNLTGDPTAEDFVKRNGNQSSSKLREVLSDFQNHSPSDISGTDLGTEAGKAALSKRAAGLDKAWRTVDQKVPSPLAYEQLVNSLDAEEAHLKMMQYRNDVAAMRKEIGAMVTTNEKTLRELKSNGPADSDAEETARNAARANTGYPGAMNETATGAVAKSTSSPALLFQPTFSEVRVRGANGAPEAVSDASRIRIDKLATEKAAAVAKADGSGTSRYKGGLRDALRNRLAESLAKDGALPSSPISVKADAPDSATGYHQFASRELATVASESKAFHDGQGHLSEGGFALGDLESDSFVGSIISDFDETLRNEQSAPASAYIGGLDSSPLFERVKLYHDRCLKQGCVRTRQE